MTDKKGHTEAAERSEIYKSLAAAFSYPCEGRGIPDMSGADYTAAFDPAVSPHACSLHESGYGDHEQSALFEELIRFYDYFGLSRSQGAQLPDHISVELEFMHFLTHLEQQVDNSRPDDLGSLRRAQRDFVTRHLQRLVQGIDNKLKIDIADRYMELVRTTAAFVDTEAEELSRTGA